MPDPLLHVDKYLSGIGLIPAPVQVLSRNAKLDDEIAREVFRLHLAALLPPEPEEGGFVVSHNNAGVRAADEVTTGTFRLFPQGRFHGFFSSKMRHYSELGSGTNSATWHYHA